jgi:hypothetical protein
MINLDRTTATRPAPIDSLRKTALVAGVIYLITFVSIPTVSLYGPVRNDPNDVLGPGPDTPILIGAIPGGDRSPGLRRHRSCTRWSSGSTRGSQWASSARGSWKPPPSSPDS